MVSLTETDFCDHEQAREFSIEGFKTHVSPYGSNKIRTILLTKNNIPATESSLDTNLPTVTVSVEAGSGKTISITSVYRQWSTSEPRKEIEDLNTILTEKKNNVLLGDFNLDVLRIEDKRYQHSTLLNSLVDISERYNLSIMHGGPTYQHKTGRSVLDYFILDKSLAVGSEVQVSPFGNSDHDAAWILLKTTTPKRTPIREVITKRARVTDPKALEEDMTRAMEELGNTLWYSDNVDYMAMEFISTFNRVYDKHAPYKTKKVRFTNSKHPLSPETLKMRKERNAARNKLMKSSPDERKVRVQVYKRLRNRVASLIKRDRARRAQQELNEGMEPYKVANKILGKRKPDDLSHLIANEGGETEAASKINDHFVDKVHQLKLKLRDQRTCDPLSKLSPSMNKFSFQDVSISQVEKIIRKMKKSHSSGPDGITSAQLKSTIRAISPVLSLMINTSFMTGLFPSVFKESWVTPIYKKKGSNLDATNYRPISNLSTVGKVLEVAACTQITQYCEANGLFGEHQHGFRKGRSTSSAITSSLLRWQEAKNNRMTTGCLLFDLSSAYDTIDHDVLLQKAAVYGFDRISLGWLGSYLASRTQRVRIKGVLSPPVNINCGVPQGSPLSCVLFLMVVSDLPRWITHSNPQGYADDTMLSTSSPDPLETIRRLEEDAKGVLDFFKANQLFANTSKTALLMIEPGQNHDGGYTIKIGNERIPESNVEKILGVEVDNKLTWDEHFKKVNKKVNYGISTLRQIQGLVPMKTMKLFLEGLINSHIRYCGSVYLAGEIQVDKTDTPSGKIRKLQVLQNEAMRVILGKRRSDQVSRTDLLNHCSTISVNHIGAGAVLQEINRASHNCSSIMDQYQFDRSSRSGPTLRTAKDPKSFKSKSARLWNKTPTSFKTGEVTSREAKKVLKETVNATPRLCYT